MLWYFCLLSMDTFSSVFFFALLVLSVSICNFSVDKQVCSRQADTSLTECFHWAISRDNLYWLSTTSPTQQQLLTLVLATAPSYISSVRIAQRTVPPTAPLLLVTRPTLERCREHRFEQFSYCLLRDAEPLLSNGCYLAAYFAVAAQQNLYML
jgi:hypothetical protein